MTEIPRGLVALECEGDLFAAQGNHGVNVGGSSGGNVGGDESDRREQKCNAPANVSASVALTP
jgi:hypothetical protein